MNKSDSEAVTVHRKTSSSTTLNRKYVRRPEQKSVEELAAEYKAAQLKRRQAIADQMNKEAAMKRFTKHPLQVSAEQKMRAIKSTPEEPRKLSAKELKEQAIAKALSQVVNNSSEKQEKELKAKPKLSFGRIVFAFSCAAILVFGITYIVNRNISDFSFRVNAMQSGFDATYPKYIPSNYNMNEITSEEGSIAISFKNNETGYNFTISESKTSWDLSALITEYVKPNFGTSYKPTQKNNITIYYTDTDAVWIHGGILYELSFNYKSLTKNQISRIADSL